MELTSQDVERIADAIHSAEQRTSAEIVCVLARRSSSYGYVPPLWAAFVALVAPWPMLLFTDLSAREIFTAQIGIFILVAIAVSWMPLRLVLTPRLVTHRRANRAAIEQFFSRNVSATKDRTGILIFVSLAERYARIVADDGLAEKVTHEEWVGALKPLLENMPYGAVAEGFVRTIEECARLAAPHAPPGGEDELPNKVYVL
jgi:putative membrane protein